MKYSYNRRIGISLSERGHYDLEEWSIPMSEYRKINGIKIPTKAEGVWKLNSGDFSYIKIEVTDVIYNDPSLEQ